jgi:hypothetical protein
MIAYNTLLNLTRHVGASRLVARRLALRLDDAEETGIRRVQESR